jgi:hypothetical protein
MNRDPIEAFAIGRTEPMGRRRPPPESTVPPETQRSVPRAIIRDGSISDNGGWGIDIEGGVIDVEGTTFIGNQQGAVRARKGAVVRMKNTKAE